MARVKENQMLLPSVLDRLIDEDPTSQTEAPKSRNQILRELKQSVRRDLENLLNTRWRCTSPPEDLTELKDSLANYGIPDFTGSAFTSSVNQDSFRSIIESAIRKFEPRFQRVSVHIIESEDSMERTLRFRIDAMLYADPAPEPVVFDTELEKTTGTFEIKAGNR